MSENNGTNTARYQFYGLIGKGGIGEVYRGYDTFFRCETAIKTLRRDHLNQNFAQYFENQFRQDFSALSKIRNAGIIRLIDFTKINSIPTWTMTLMNGASWQQYSGQQIPFNQAASMLVPVADTLSYAHQFGIVHGNLKLTNIFWSNAQTPVLSDFCLTKYLSVNNHGYGNFEADYGIGSPEYLAPEQALGRPVDPRSDIYSLGIIFYELITGKKPFLAISPMEIMAKQVNEQLPSPRFFTQNLTPEVEQALYNATAKNPDLRIQNMGEFAYMLRNIASSQSGYYPPVQPIVPLNPNPDDVDEDDSENDIPFYMKIVNFFKYSRQRMIIGGMVLAVILALIIGSVIASNNKKIEAVNQTNTQQALSIQETQTAVAISAEQHMMETQSAVEAAQAAEKAATEAAASAATAAALPTTAPAAVVEIPQATLAPTAALVAVARFQSQDPADGTKKVPNETFKVTWTLENSGTSEWTDAYKLVFSSGTNFSVGAIKEVYFPQYIYPNGAGGISIDCIAPNATGTYYSEWVLKDADGNGFSTTGAYLLSITIEVVSGTLTATPSITSTATAVP